MNPSVNDELAMPKRKKNKRSKSRKKRKTLAAQADPFLLYQKSVQKPDFDIDFFTKTYKRYRRRKPRSLREDFCGTAYLATEWVKGHPKRTAIGVDLDTPTLAWARQNVVAVQKPKVQRRFELIHGDVLEVVEPTVDVTCALNFSYCIFKTREQLQKYFEVAHRGLAADGVFITELYGGTEAIEETEEERDVEDFVYVWEQAKYNPITNETLCHIHFDFADGSRLERAYTYDWRLWTIPEVRECMLMAGFERVDVYWEGVEKDGEGSGEYYITKEEENQETWLVYIVGIK